MPAKDFIRTGEMWEYALALRNAALDAADLPGQDMTFVYQSAGHANNHFTMTESDMLQRLLREKQYASMNAVTSFYSEEAAKEEICNAIAFKADEITNWVFKNRSEFSRDDELYSERGRNPPLFPYTGKTRKSCARKQGYT